MSAGSLLDLSRRPPPDVDGVWHSVSEIARLKGVEKSSISRRVKRLEEQGLVETRSGPGGQKLVRLAAYDRATGDVADAAAGVSSGGLSGIVSEPLSKHGGLAREQARRVAYQADIAELDLAEARAKTLAAERVRAVAVDAAEKIIAHLASIPRASANIAGAVVNGGAAGLRTFLRSFVDDLMRDIAEDFKPTADVAIVVEPWPMPPAALAEMEAETAERWRRLRKVTHRVLIDSEQR